MPAMDGLETLRRLKTVAPNLPVVMITVDTDVAAAVEAMLGICGNSTVASAVGSAQQQPSDSLSRQSEKGGSIRYQPARASGVYSTALSSIDEPPARSARVTA